MVDRFRLVAVGVAFSLLFVLPAGVGPSDAEPDASELVEKAVESLEEDPVRAIHEQTITNPGGTVTQTVAVHRTATRKGYIEVLDQQNGTDEQVVVEGSSTGQSGNGGERVRNSELSQFWFDELRTLGASPEEVLAHYQSNYVGMGEVDGRSAYIVELVAPKETTAGLSLDIDAGDIEYHVPLHEATHREWYLSRETWWIDTKTHYPIKQTVEWTDEDGTVLATATREYKQLTVGPAVENTRPALGEPDESNESESGSADESAPEKQTDQGRHAAVDTRLFSSARAAGATVPFELPELTVPDGYAFDRATVASENETAAVLLLYTDANSGTQLSVQVSERDSSLFYHNVEIRRESMSAFDGELVVTDTGTAVVRDCGPLTYRIRGPPAAKTLIDVATSIECQHAPKEAGRKRTR
jgi:hypothetical protein